MTTKSHIKDDYSTIPSRKKSFEKTKNYQRRRLSSSAHKSNSFEQSRTDSEHLRFQETRIPSFRTDTIYNVKGQISSIPFIGTQKAKLSDNLPVIKEMTRLLIKHPDYNKKTWNKNDSMSDVVLHITNSFDRLFANEYPVYIFKPESRKPTFHWIHVCKESYSGNSTVLEFNFIHHLRKKNRKLYNLTKQFLHIWSPLRIDWTSHGDYSLDLEWQMEHAPEELEGWIDDIDSIKKGFRKWKRIYKFISKWTHTPCSIQEFKNNLDNYNPRIPAYIKLKNWFLGVIELIEHKINLDEFQNSPLTQGNYYDRNYFTNGEAWPGQYVTFTWDLGDTIGHQICGYLDDTCNQVGIVPLIEHQQINPSCLTPPSFGKAQKLFDWLQIGQDTIRHLYQHNS